MKKSLFVLTALLSCFLFSACMPEGFDEGTETGSISGTVKYSNAEDNSNIYLTVEKITASTNEASAADTSITQNVVRSAEDVEAAAVIYTKADADGKYTFENLPVGKYKVYASSVTCAEEAVWVIAIVNANTITIPDDLTLTATGSITGKIILNGSEDDNADFIVFLSGTSYVAITDSDGTFEITNVPAGKEYKVKILKGQSSLLWTTITPKAFEKNTLEDKAVTDSDFVIAKDGVDGKDGASIVWLGAFASADEITNPEKLNVFYNTTDGCSYIYDGEKWTLLASSGKQGEKGDKGDTGNDGTVTIYCRAPECLLKLVLMDGTYAPEIDLPENYVAGGTIVLPNVIKEGKDFAGWFADSEYMTPCEFVAYDEEKAAYTLTVPEGYTDTITLYAAFGKVIENWADYVSYVKSKQYGGYDIIFFSGTIEVTENCNISNWPHIIVRLRGMNNAVLSLKCNLQVSSLCNIYNICNITFDGNNTYAAHIENSAAYSPMTIKNCVFRNMAGGSDIDHVINSV